MPRITVQLIKGAGVMTNASVVLLEFAEDRILQVKEIMVRK